MGVDIKGMFEELEIPIYFIVGKEDDVTPVEVVKSLHDNYKHEEKYLKLIYGEHHSMRSKETIEDICEFINEVFTGIRRAKTIKEEEKIEKERGVTRLSINHETGEQLKPIKMQKSKVCIRPKKNKLSVPVVNNRGKNEEENIETRLQKDKNQDIWVFKE